MSCRLCITAYLVGSYDSFLFLPGDEFILPDLAVFFFFFRKYVKKLVCKYDHSKDKTFGLRGVHGVQHLS